MPTRKAVTAIAVALAAATVAACGGEEASPKDTVAAAATKNADAGTSRVSFDSSIKVSGVGDEIAATGEGVTDYRERFTRMRLDMSEFAEAQSGNLGDPDAWVGEMVFDSGVIYMRLPLFKRVFPKSKPWIKVDADALAEQGGTQFDQPDPTELLQFLRAAGRDVKEVRDEKVRGVETTHYRARVDLDAVPKVVPKEMRERMDSYVDRLEGIGVDRVPVDAWIDADGIARRVGVKYDDIQLGSRKGDIAFTIEFYDFGVDVDTEPPPANQVSDLLQLIQRGQL